MIAVLGSSGRLARILRQVWGQEGATWLGRNASDLPAADVVIDLRGIVPGKGDVWTNVDLAQDAIAQVPSKARLILASTAAVYGKHAGPLHEDVSAPISEYGKAKLAVERAALESGRCVSVLRIGNVAGADAILGGHHEGFTLDTFPDGSTPRRSYIGPLSFARVLRELAQLTDLPKVLNLACPGTVEMGALLDAAGLPWTPRPATAHTIADVTLDTSRLEHLVSFPPECQTPQGIVSEWKTVTA